MGIEESTSDHTVCKWKTNSFHLHHCSHSCALRRICHSFWHRKPKPLIRVPEVSARAWWWVLISHSVRLLGYVMDGSQLRIGFPAVVRGSSTSAKASRPAVYSTHNPLQCFVPNGMIMTYQLYTVLRLRIRGCVPPPLHAPLSWSVQLTVWRPTTHIWVLPHR